MLKQAITYKHWSHTPPLQPFIVKYASTYLQRQVSWNPHCIKKDALFYQFQTGDEETTIEVIPDACLNVLFRLDPTAPNASFTGTLLSTKSQPLKPGTVYFGFKPYSNLGIKSTTLSPCELLDTSVDFSYVLPGVDRLLDGLLKAENFSDRISKFMEVAAQCLIDDSYQPTFVDYMAVMMCSSYGNVTFTNMYKDIGYSERYCCMMFKDIYGIPPKKYSDIIRFQNTVKMLVSGSCDDLSSLAVDGGYYDQAHLSRNFKRYVNTPPERYLRRCIEANAN